MREPRFAAVPALPPAVAACLRAAGPELRAAAKKDPVRFAKELNALLSSAAAALGCRPDEALFLTGFEARNRTPGRLDAALAELRAVLFLEAEGFEDIRALPRAAGRTADLGAARGGQSYRFEVRWVSGGFGEGDEKRLAAKALKKAAQLRAALKKTGGPGALIFVAGPSGGRFRRSAALEAAARAAHSGLRPGRIHVALVSGDGAAVFPPWGR